MHRREPYSTKNVFTVHSSKFTQFPNKPGESNHEVSNELKVESSKFTGKCYEPHFPRGQLFLKVATKSSPKSLWTQVPNPQLG